MGESWEGIDPGDLAALGDAAARGEYFAARPELARPELVWRLAEAVAPLARVDLDRAEALAATTRWLAEEVADPAARARALRAVANVLYFRRRYEAAVEAYEQSLMGFEEVGNTLEAAITRSSAIGSLSYLARYDRAMEYARRARQIYEAHDDQLHLARLEVALGHIECRQDRFPKAIERYRQALDIFITGVGLPVDVAGTLRNIAVCYQDLNDFHASLEAYFEARDYCQEHDLTLVGLEVEYNIAYIYYLRGEYSQAIHLFEEARRHSREQDDPHHAALCELDLAEIFLELNLVEDAQHLAERSFVAFDELGMPYEAAKGLAYRALAAARRDNRGLALELLRQARRIFEQQENRVWVAMVELYEALILFAEGRLEEAAIRADAASAGFRDSGVPSRRVPCEILRATTRRRRWPPIVAPTKPSRACGASCRPMS